jgi:hypothetical protein
VSDGNTNDSGSDSKVDYNTKHVYFYLPKVPTKMGKSRTISTLVRCCGLADIATWSSKPRMSLQINNITIRKNTSNLRARVVKTSFKKSAGSSDQSSHGILMACDGHFLLKAAEKMFVETGDHHLQVNGDYEHETTGSVNVQSGDIMSLKSGTNKTLTLNAGDKTGDMELLANNKTETLQGNRTTTTSGDNSDTTSGNDSKITWGFTKKINGGVNWTAFIEGQLVTATWGLQVYLGTLIKVYPVSEVVLAGMRFQATGLNVASVQTQVGYKALSADTFAAKVSNVLTGLVDQQIRITQATLTTQQRAVQANVDELQARQVEMDANLVGVIAFL